MSEIRAAGEAQPTSEISYTDDEVAEFYKNYPLASGVEIPDMQTAQAASNKDSCMSDLLSIVKLIFPVVTAAAG
jgi:hypothetical protein